MSKSCEVTRGDGRESLRMDSHLYILLFNEKPPAPRCEVMTLMKQMCGGISSIESDLCLILLQKSQASSLLQQQSSHILGPLFFKWRGETMSVFLRTKLVSLWAKGALHRRASLFCVPPLTDVVMQALTEMINTDEAN